VCAVVTFAYYLRPAPADGRGSRTRACEITADARTMCGPRYAAVMSCRVAVTGGS